MQISSGMGMSAAYQAAMQSVWVKELNLASQSARRDRTRNLAANHALDMVRRWLAGLNPEGTA